MSVLEFKFQQSERTAGGNFPIGTDLVTYPPFGTLENRRGDAGREPAMRTIRSVIHKGSLVENTRKLHLSRWKEIRKYVGISNELSDRWGSMAQSEVQATFNQSHVDVFLGQEASKSQERKSQTPSAAAPAKEVTTPSTDAVYTAPIDLNDVNLKAKAKVMPGNPKSPSGSKGVTTDCSWRGTRNPDCKCQTCSSKTTVLSLHAAQSEFTKSTHFSRVSRTLRLST